MCRKIAHPKLAQGPRGVGLQGPFRLDVIHAAAAPASLTKVQQCDVRAGEGESPFNGRPPLHPPISDEVQGCQMAKFDPFLGLRQGGGRGGAIQGKEGIKFCSVA